MSGQRVILLMLAGIALIVIVAAIAAACLERPALRDDAGSAFIPAGLSTPL
jgi:hypothetical protein